MGKFASDWKDIKELLFDTHPLMQLVMRLLTGILGGMIFSYLAAKSLSLLNPLGAVETIFFCGWLVPLIYAIAMIYAFWTERLEPCWRLIGCSFVLNLILWGTLALLKARGGLLW
jgi:hypothetical protein